MNCYVDAGRISELLSIATADVADALVIADAASRIADQMTGRHFYTETATRYYDGTERDTLPVHDLLSITSLKTDADLDESYSDTWVKGTDFEVIPDNGYPWTAIRRKRGDSLFNLYAPSSNQANWIQIVGTFGAGDMRSADPWASAGLTGTVASTDGTSLTISVSAGLVAGQTIKIGSEQMFVQSVTTTTATVVRAVNGTTGTTHAGQAVYKAVYPAVIVNGTEAVAGILHRNIGGAGMIQETIKNYSYMRSTAANEDAQIRRIFSNLRREPWF